MDRKVFKDKVFISYLVSQAIEGRLTEYENDVLETISVLADSLFRLNRDLSNVTFSFSVSCSPEK